MDPQSAEEIRRHLEQTCDRCGAQVGEGCKTKGGNPAAYPHANRWWKAVAAGRAPLTAEEIDRAYQH